MTHCTMTSMKKDHRHRCRHRHQVWNSIAIDGTAQWYRIKSISIKIEWNSQEKLKNQKKKSKKKPKKKINKKKKHHNCTHNQHTKPTTYPIHIPSYIFKMKLLFLLPPMMKNKTNKIAKKALENCNHLTFRKEWKKNKTKKKIVGKQKQTKCIKYQVISVLLKASYRI